MKSLLTVFIFSVAAIQVFETYALPEKKVLFSITFFYETLCFDHVELFELLRLAVHSETLGPVFKVELVPFGKANFTEDPFNITCQHGPEECYGNVMNACFLAKHPELTKQLDFVTCCMNDTNPPQAGERCAKELGFGFDDVKECARNKEGIALQIKNGKRTHELLPSDANIPSSIINNVYYAKEFLTDMKGLIIQKIKAMGVKLDI